MRVDFSLYIESQNSISKAWCGNFSYLEIESLKLDLQTKKLKKKISPSLSYKPRFRSKISLQPKNNREREREIQSWSERALVAHGVRLGSRTRPRPHPGNSRWVSIFSLYFFFVGSSLCSLKFWVLLWGI